MANRQYGILPGASLTGTPPPQQHAQRASTRVSRPYESVQRNRDARSSDMDAPPPPPAHRSLVSTQARLPETSSDISDYEPPNPFRDVDNLYSLPMRTSSPAQNSVYEAARSQYSPPARPDARRSHYSQQSVAPLVAHGAAPAFQSPSVGTASPYRDGASSRLSAPSLMARQSYFQGDGYDEFDPTSIADDDDDGIREHPPRSRSRLGFGAAAAVMPAFIKTRDVSGKYNNVPNTNFANKTQVSEKEAWHDDDHHDASHRRKRMLLVIGGIVLVLIVIGATVGGVLASKNKSSTTSSSTSSSGTHSGGLYDLDSKEIQQLMGNKDLHRVFPAMDYTPLNAQYPACLSNPPQQNDVTMDVAMLSQLTPAIRLYGTDCNQTEMVLTAFDRLKMNDTMSLWLGVWLGTNTTTNDRQLAQMYDLLDKYPSSHFAGIIVGNEVLFRKDMTLSQLGTVLTSVRTKLAAKKISLPVATSDLGDDWTAELAATSDIVMANVHPFFAGVTPDVAPGWTYNFWQTHNAKLAPASTGSWPKSIISEVGWPSEGGNDCGTTTGTCASGQGAVASIDNMNKFMDGFVCQSLTNGTHFFWFEAFDEPWKVIFETDTDGWESHWGLIDTKRQLKSGVKIPDCGGKTLSKPY